MPQFDLYQSQRRGPYPLLLDIQADFLARLATRIVVPLAPVKHHRARPIGRLNPATSFQGTDYVLIFQELAAVPLTALGDRVGSLGTLRQDLIAAVDLLFTGT